MCPGPELRVRAGTLDPKKLDAVREAHAKERGLLETIFQSIQEGIIVVDREVKSEAEAVTTYMTGEKDVSIVTVICNADAALASVLAAGGRVMAELHDYPGGRRFTFADPSGNVLGVYEPSE